MFENKTTLEIVQIAAAGGGFRLKANNRTTLELVQIAAASNKGTKIFFSGLRNRTQLELVQIAAAGKGCIFFDDELT